MLWVLIRITSAEVILMSTHNICFYGELMKIILELFIIKYPSYLNTMEATSWIYSQTLNIIIKHFLLLLDVLDLFLAFGTK